ncbi:MAG TPA: hypothetical protein EYN06_08980 [Myxococcales bacterium]|nr:hypothetical protein [Myxococcales bacterium]HIN86600.1 hypothetical protein [Myxococcales bacterium]
MARVTTLFFLALFTAACGEASVLDWNAGTSAFPLPDESKGDNYISSNAREYLLTGTAFAPLPEGFDALSDEERASTLESTVGSHLTKVVRSIKRDVTNAIRTANGGSLDKKDAFFIYVKRDAGESHSTEVQFDGTARYQFTLELVGNWYLMSAVAPGDSSIRSFDVKIQGYMGEPDAPVVSVQIQGTQSQDAFPKYNELFEDGVFDIAIHFGGDYNSGRHDLETVKWLLETLTKDGWENPYVTDFDSLKIDSPPFTRTLKVEGRDIETRIKIVHSDMVEEADEEKLSDSMKESFATADIVVYSGHAGSGAGFILDYQPKHEIKAADFATLPLAEKYQIYVFDGCMTYRTYVDDMMKNPAKNWDNVDIMTTVNTTPFGAGYQVLWELIYWLTLTNDNGDHFPLSWKTLLRGINTRSFKEVHYGVHGVDADPQLNPHGGVEMLCRACQIDGDCGPGGNLCLGYNTGASCGVACTTDKACPDGFRCARITEDPDLFYLAKQCVKRSYSCQ